MKYVHVCMLLATLMLACFVSFVGTFEVQISVMSGTGVYYCKLHCVKVACFCTRHHL